MLSLAPTQIDAAVVVGKRVRATKRAKLSPALWEEAWGEGLSPYDTTLSSMLRALGTPKNVRTSVLYTSPGSVTEVRKAPGQGESGIDAARLELVEGIASGGLEYISSAARLNHREGPDVLVAADRDINAQAVFAWLSRCGCRLESLVPARAIALRSVIQDVTSRDEDTAITCYLGERSTVIASGGKGALHSIRSIDFGYSLLVEALARGYRQEVEEGGASDVCSNHAEARERLFEVGLPTGKDGQSGTDVIRRVMPLLQPVLQRYCIEIKQTIRFGVPEITGASRVLRLTGPGAAIHGFVDPISQSIDSETIVDQQWQRINPEEVCGPNTLEHDFIEQDSQELRLVPRIVREQNAARMVSSGVRAGAMCAALLLASEAGYIYSSRMEVSQSLKACETSLVGVREYRRQTELAGQMAVSLAAAEGRTFDQLKSSPDWYAVMAELAAMNTPGVTLNVIRGSRDTGATYLVVEGVALLGDGSAEGLSALVDRLRVSPLYEEVQLGSTSLVEAGGRSARRFELRLTPRLFSPSLPIASVDAAGSDEQAVSP